MPTPSPTRDSHWELHQLLIIYELGSRSPETDAGSSQEDICPGPEAKAYRTTTAPKPCAVEARLPAPAPGQRQGLILSG